MEDENRLYSIYMTGDKFTTNRMPFITVKCKPEEIVKIITTMNYHSNFTPPRDYSSLGCSSKWWAYQEYMAAFNSFEEFNEFIERRTKETVEEIAKRRVYKAFEDFGY